MRCTWQKPPTFSDGSQVEAWNKVVYGGLLDDFEQFEFDRKHSYIRLTGRHMHTGQQVQRRIPISYRTDEKYQKRILARFYKLDKWYQSLPTWSLGVSMVTLTSKQKGMVYGEQYNFIQECYRTWRDNVRKQVDLGEYVLIAEPHKTGYMHYHILYFTEFSQSEQEILKTAWLATGAGNEHSFRCDVSKQLRRARNYLMKYIKKSLLKDDNSNGMLPDSDLKRFDDGNDMHFLVFNAVLWMLNKHDNEYKGVRAFQMSRGLSKITKLDKFGEDCFIDWYLVEFVTPMGEVFPIHEKPVPDFNPPDIPNFA
jgi:hypothetical protein